MAIAKRNEEEIVVGMYDRGLLSFPDGGVNLDLERVSPYHYNSRAIGSINAELARSSRMSAAQQFRLRSLMVGDLVTACIDIGEREPFRHVVGKARAGAVLASLTAHQAGLSYLSSRSPEVRPHSALGMIEGDYEEGDRVLLLRSTVTTVPSALADIAALQEVGLVPVGVVMEFDRQEDGTRILRDQDLEVAAVTTISHAARLLIDHERINNTQFDALQLYHDRLRGQGIPTDFELAS